MLRVTALSFLALVLSACTDRALTLLVDARTDLAPNLDFARARTRLAHVDGGLVVATTYADASTGADYLAGQRVAELEPLSPGLYRVEVSLLSGSGREVLSRSALVTLDASSVVTILLTSSCLGVECPGAGDPPDATACHGGRCTFEGCTPETPEGCPEPECAVDADCEAGADCGVGRCIGGLCYFDAASADCAPGERCRPDIGCAVCDEDGVCAPADPCRDVSCPIGSTCVEGICEPCDAGETLCGDGEDEDCDGLTDCEDDDCEGERCGDGLVCVGGACDCPTRETDCDDGEDGDCDGRVDCDDGDCDGRTCGPSGRTCIGGGRCGWRGKNCLSNCGDCVGCPGDFSQQAECMDRFACDLPSGTRGRYEVDGTWTTHNDCAICNAFGGPREWEIWDR